MRTRLPAGGALAVDRDGFSRAVTEPRWRAIRWSASERGEIAGLPPEDWDSVIVATGPLTSPALAEAIRGLTGETALAFFDAIAPIVHRETDRHRQGLVPVALRQARPGGDGADYINCALDKEQYHAFIDALLAGEKTEFKEWETNTPYFEGCLPIEVMAGARLRRRCASAR